MLGDPEGSFARLGILGDGSDWLRAAEWLFVCNKGKEWSSWPDDAIKAANPLEATDWPPKRNNPPTAATALRPLLLFCLLFLFFIVQHLPLFVWLLTSLLLLLTVGSNLLIIDSDPPPLICRFGRMLLNCVQLRFFRSATRPKRAAPSLEPNKRRTPGAPSQQCPLLLPHPNNRQRIRAIIQHFGDSDDSLWAVKQVEERRESNFFR